MKRRTSPLRYLWLLGLLSIALVLLTLSGGLTATATIGSEAAVSGSQNRTTAVAYTITSVTYSLSNGRFDKVTISLTPNDIASTEVGVRFSGVSTIYSCTRVGPNYECNVAAANIHASTLPSIDIIAVQ